MQKKRKRAPSSKNRSRAKKSSPSESLINLFSLFSKGKKRKKSASNNSSLIKFFRWALCIVSVGGFFIWSGIESLPPPIPSGDQPPILFSNQCDDDLRAVYLQAIGEAKHSILLCMYSLTDSKVIKALKERADAGVDITVIHDPSTPQFGFKKLGSKIHRIEKNGSGLMHQKILIVDQEKIWLGSANFTTESLRVHDNLVIAMGCPALAETILERAPMHPHDFVVGGQNIEYWSLPEDKAEGVQKLLDLIDTAQKTIRVAMFTWTHPDLTAAVIRAHKRNVNVEIVIDYQQGTGVSEKWFLELKKAGVPVKLSSGAELLHHKFAYIDNKILINGSANWTKAAFSKNDDCFLILNNLNDEQREKMDRIWHAIRATASQEFWEDLKIAA